MRRPLIERGDRRDLVTKRKAMHAESLRWGAELREIPRERWPAYTAHLQCPPVRALRSRAFLVMEYAESNGGVRLTISRSQLADDGDFRQDIWWEDIQRLKRECGYGDRCAVEIFPPDEFIVNVANMRHIWLCESPAFMWTGLATRDTVSPTVGEQEPSEARTTADVIPKDAENQPPESPA